MNFLFLLSFLLFATAEDFSSTAEIIFTYEGNQLESVNKEQYFNPIFNKTFHDTKNIESLINRIGDRVLKRPINASITDTGKIIPEIAGEALNRDQTKILFIQSLYDSESRTIELPTIPLYPRVTSELLSEISVRKIKEYNTFYKEVNIERSHNIKLATNAINNYVLFPGEIFSFNKIVGERTAKRGYQRAPVIVKGEYAEDIGGGICQVSSTLYNAVILKGVQIIERYSHSREVPYVPPGKDATVSWWGPDFAFKNNYREPILIRAFAQNGNMRVAIYSANHVVDVD